MRSPVIQRGVVGSEEHGDLGDVVRLADAAERRPPTMSFSKSLPMTPSCACLRSRRRPGSIVLTRILRGAELVREHARDRIERALGARSRRLPSASGLKAATELMLMTLPPSAGSA